jgi:molybdopterin/thiamine biosynthesis adenylyltransferase/rhodanese-related sulfurtransferase
VTEGGPPERGTPDHDRYARQLLLPEIGPAGQARLRSASVLVAGAGGLGSPALQYLAAAGVGRIGIADPDAVELSNLHRQPIYGSAGIGRPKAAEAAARMREINPDVETVVHPVARTAANAEAIIGPYDLILDCTDNFPARYVLNDAALVLGKPLIHASVHRFEGQVAVFGLDGGPCYRCLHPVPPPEGLVPDCATGGVLGVLPGVVGTVQASEALKIITGAGKALSGRMLVIDLLGPSFREIAVRKDPACPACGRGGRAAARAPGTATRIAVAAGEAAGPAAKVPGAVTAAELRSALAAGEPITVIDVREHDEYAGFNIGGIHIPLRLIQRRLEGLDRSRPIVVVCESGSRSFVAAAMLAAAGFASVRNLSGGLSAWRRL